MATLAPLSDQRWVRSPGTVYTASMYVIGTAGHVDHGKSTLVEALTGIHPDRLREERERGLTIELGFAWMELPSGREVSIIDVPGHVRFVRHMLAGVGAIDLALFVVAADEGVMPQTCEHLEILDLLDVSHGIVVLTKCDLVDEEWTELVEEEVHRTFADTSLGSAPVLRVSATTGRGLDELRTAIDRALDAVPEPRDNGHPRFGIDRVFTMTGFGTVVTGTLLDGPLHVGDTVEAVPGGPTARIRGLQTHRRAVDEATPGTRVAVNLAGVGVNDLSRGQVLAEPGRLEPMLTFDARVRALERRALRHNLRVAVHLGAAEAQARLRVLDGEEVATGSEGWCQLVLTSPLAATAGELFVLRISDETLGGGRVVQTNAPRHRRNDAAVLARLEALATGTAESRALSTLEEIEPCTAAQLGQAIELDEAAVRAALTRLVAGGDALALDAPTLDGKAPGDDGATAGATLYLSAAGRRRLTARALRLLDAYHREHPLRFGTPADELRGRLGLSSPGFARVLPALAPEVASSTEAATTRRLLRRAGWTPALTAAQRREADAVVEQVTAGGAAPPRLSTDPELIAYLDGAGRVVDCGDGVVFAAEAFAQAREAVVQELRGHGSLTLAEARDALGANRRATQALLEALDHRGVTERRGDARVLTAGATP